MRRGPSFLIVTLVVVTLSLLGLCSKALQPLIPPPKSNRLSGESAEYLQEAASQLIDWRPFDEAAFAESRRLDKPVYLVIGAPWSRAARDLDRDAFQYGEVQTYLNRNFICVRVDTFERPDWQVAYFPISRLHQGFFRSGFQSWVLDTQGRPYEFIGRVRPDEQLDHQSILAMLIGARHEFDQRQRQPYNAPDISTKQLNEMRAIETIRNSSPDFARHSATLGQSLDQANGGFPEWGAQELLPNAWRYQIICGHASEFDSTAKSFMRSPMVDLLDGGFFLSSQSQDWKQLNFDKVATVQAETMSTLAIDGAVTGNKLATWLAARAFDSLTGEFTQQGLLAGCRLGDEQRFGRSARCSFTPKRLESLVPSAEDRKWATTSLGLELSKNPMLSPFLASELVPFEESSKMDSILGPLRKGAAQPNFAGQRLMDVNGIAIARLIETARIIRDPSRLRSALDLFERLDQFRARDDVAHGLTGRAANEAYLSDYLAYSDAALEDFLATGNAASFERGLAVLVRARFLFAGAAPGEFLMSQDPASTVLPRDTHVPELGDTLCESCTARMIRLCGAYGRLLLEATNRSGSRREIGLSLLQTAYAAIGRFAAFANNGGPRVSGFFCAAAGLQDNVYAVTVGPRSHELCDQLVAIQPYRLVSQATGPVRPDLQKREPGVYLINDTKVEGPYAVEAASNRLGHKLLCGG